MPNLMNTMMELRKCCNHPYLIKGNLAVHDNKKTIVFVLICAASIGTLLECLCVWNRH